MLLPYFKNIFLHIICGHFNPQAFIPSLFWKSLDYILFALYKSVLISTDTSACLRDQLPGSWQGCNHGWKVEKDQRPGWVLGARGGRPFPLWGSGGFAPRKFVKTQMLNPAFWWLLAVKFLAFWKLRPRSWGTNTLLVPKPKSWGTSLPRSLRLLCLWLMLLSLLRFISHTPLRHPSPFHFSTQNSSVPQILPTTDCWSHFTRTLWLFWNRNSHASQFLIVFFFC